MNLEKLKDAARKHEQREEWRKAIEVYQRILEGFESGADNAPDLAIYNKVGDLLLKVGDVPSAVHSYERAADLYAEQGFANNAIAVCGKILRYDPHRSRTYMQLARLHARKNMVGEAKKNLIEYLERMNRDGLRDAAVRDVTEFADQFASSEEIRVMLAELLRVASRGVEAREQLEKLAAQLEQRGDEAGARRTRERMEEIDPTFPSPREEPKRRGELVFLNLDDDAPGAAAPGATAVESPADPPADIDPEDIGVSVSSADLLDVELVAGTADLDVVPLDGLDRLNVGELDNLDLVPVDPDLVVDRVETGPTLAPPLDGLEGTGLVSDFSLELSRVQDEESPDRIHEEALLGDVEFTTGVEEPALPPPVMAPAEAEEETPAARVAALEDQVLDDPDNPEVHRALGEALLATGEHDRGVEELHLALARFEELEDWDRAENMAQELARLDPSGILYFQKLVEIAFRAGHRGRVIEAYLELGDALVRTGAVEKALAVYRRVAEQDAGNPRALAALDALAPPPPPAPPAAASPAAPAPAPPPARATPPAAGFVDLGAMLLDGDQAGGGGGRPRDTRMRVQDEEPTGDEERDFAEILKQFKRGLDENLDAEDFQAHYDLGIAFKEMGLLDEAIAEFQKALRSPDARLRTSEALGSSFFDKGQFAVAEAILRRAVDGLSGQDDEKIGLLYWLGRALEAEGRPQEAQPYYRRALAVDIHFMDLAERLRGISKGGTP